MQIEMHGKERSTLATFAEKNSLVMEIHERTPQDMGRRWTENSRYYACFKSCEVKDGSILSGTFGNGATLDEAMSEYAQKISEKRLVIDATSKDTRREIYAPILTHNATSHRDARHSAAELSLKADKLADELREVIGWARTEKAPLREQEIRSIERVLADYEA